MEYSFISQEKFDQIIEHLNSISKPDRSIITNELAAQMMWKNKIIT